MRYLVTGGAGFIGSNLCNRLVSEGNNVIALDSLFLGNKKNLDKRVKFVKGSVTNQKKVEKLVRKVDLVFHLAAPSSSPMYVENPLFMKDNIDGFANVLNSCSVNGKRLVYASTSSMYNGNETPFREDQVIVPKTFYEAAFFSREQFARAYHLQKGLECIGLRFFSVYGPNESHKKEFANIITQFLWDMKKGKSPLVYGDGTQYRDFTHVSDIVEGLILASKKSGFGIYNLGTGEEHSFNDVVETLNRKLGTSIKPTYTPNKIHNYVHSTLCDVSLAKRELGFSAKVSFEKGIEMLVKEY